MIEKDEEFAAGLRATGLEMALMIVGEDVMAYNGVSRLINTADLLFQYMAKGLEEE